MNLFQALKMSCRDATYLHEKKKAGKTTMAENMGLWWHLVVCKFCALFFKQVEHLEHAAGTIAHNAEKHAHLSNQQKQAIADALKREMGKS